MIGIKMNQVLVLLALACAASAYHNEVYVTKHNYRRDTETLAKTSAEDAVDGNDGKEGLIYVPPYTTWLKDLDTALAELKRYLVRGDERDNNSNDLFVQYAMIVNVVNQLVDTSLADEKMYDMVYFNVVPAIILETINNPQDSADKVRAQAERSNAKVSAIRDLIVSKQQNSCTDPESYACDLIIDIAIKTSGDELLKRQASFMQTLSGAFELFLQDYANEFSDVSVNKRSTSYLINGIDRLRPLVLAAGKARNEGKLTPPLQFRGTDNKPL